MLKNAKDSTVKARAQTLNQINTLGYRAPAEVFHGNSAFDEKG